MSSNALRTVPFPEPLSPVMMTKGVLLGVEWGVINSEAQTSNEPANPAGECLGLDEPEISVSTPVDDAHALRFGIPENDKLAV